jgi:hypothetical protein
MAIKLSLIEIRNLTLLLRLIDLAPSKRMSEAQIIQLGENSDRLTCYERQSVPSRTDSRFANWVHNVVCHRDLARNPIRQKLINWDPQASSFALTDKGQKFLDDMSTTLDAAASKIRMEVDHWLTQYARGGNNKGGHQ